MSTGNSANHAHHFDSPEHEYESSKLAMWLFLCTEILMFGGLFVAYAYYYSLFPEVFLLGSEYTDWKLGAVNTVVLLFSSLTMALSIFYIQKRNNARAFNMLLVTLVCGAIFMIVKYFEYAHKFEYGFLPGSWFHGDLHGIENFPLYFSFYYSMTGIHGIHVLIGMGLIAWVMLRLKRGEFSPQKYTAVECVGLFWHLVDLVWIYLFPLLYLVE